MFEQGARLGATINASADLPLERLSLDGREVPQATIHLVRTDREQRLFQSQSQSKAVFDLRQPQWEHGFQPHRPGIAGRFPDLAPDREHASTIGFAARVRP